MSLLLFAALGAAVRGYWVTASFALLASALVKSSSPPFALALITAVWIAYVLGVSPAVSRPRAIVTTAVAALATVAWPLTVGIAFGRINALTEVHSAWGRTSIPFRDTWTALSRGPGDFTAQWFCSVAIVTIVTMAGILLLRDQRYPWHLRLSGFLLPMFVLFMSISLSAPRLLLPDLSLPAVERRLVRGALSVVIMMLILMVVRGLWINLFPGGGAGDPAP